MSQQGRNREISQCTSSKYFHKSKTSTQIKNNGEKADQADTPASQVKGVDDTEDEGTLEYELKDEENYYSSASYTHKDFLTDSEDDDDAYEDNISTNKNSETQEPIRKKLRQTTIDSFRVSKPASSSSSTSQPTKLERKATRRTIMTWNEADTENYRRGYPGLKDDFSLKSNLLFYTGKIASRPEGDYIDAIHSKWFGQYKLLERHHGYIQWLFPIREDGMNCHSQALQLHEAQAIKKNKKTQERVITSYKLMLDFYGMKLVDQGSGKLARSKNWKARFDNLNWSSHNYLRITRILKSLGELGYEHLKKPFLSFLMEEAAVHYTLTRTFRSLRDYWIGTIKDDDDRAELYKKVADIRL